MLLIADSGSTKTEWRLVAPDGQTTAARTDGLNPYFLDTPAITATLQQQLKPALGRYAGADVAPTAVFFYGAGCAGEAACGRVAEALLRCFPSLQTVSVQSDMLGAARAACQRSAGVVCILGTGSNAAFYDGERITSPGYSLGFWLGDEGSGGHLGKSLVLAHLHGQLPEPLHSAFQEEYPLDRLTVLNSAYQQPAPNRWFAGFTPFLSEHIAHPFIQELVEASFRQFVRLYVRRVLPHENSGNVAPFGGTVNFVGSVGFYFRDQLTSVMRAEGLALGQILPAPIDALVAYHR